MGSIMPSKDLVRRIEEMMSSYAQMRERQFKPADRDVLTGYLSGMELLARKLGVDCTCRLRSRECFCKPLPEKSIRAMRAIERQQRRADARALELETFTPKSRRRR